MSISLFLLVATLNAQLSVFTVRGTEERALSGIVDLGRTATGDTLETHFRIRNTGNLSTPLTSLDVAGDGFSLFRNPPLPFPLPPNFSVDFMVRFVSAQPRSDARATLRINSATVTLIASADPAASVFAIEPDRTRLPRHDGESTVFAPVEKGQQGSRPFLVENTLASSIAIGAISIEGESFRLEGPRALTLGPGQSETLTVVFQPSRSGLHRGALLLDGRRFLLEGVGTEPPFPKPIVVLESATLESSKQVRVAVRFDEPSRAEGSGELRVEFTPTVSGPDDAAIALLPNGRRSVTFQVRAGESEALFNGQRGVLLQTGTTAGNIRFLAESGGFRHEATASIAPVPPTLDKLVGRKGVEILELTITGYDNARSASEIAFTFFDSAGAPVAPGQLRTDVSEIFSRYFRTTEAGGMFQIRASFPATANTNAIHSVEIEMRNSAGVRRFERTAF